MFLVQEKYKVSGFKFGHAATLSTQVHDRASGFKLSFVSDLGLGFKGHGPRL